MELGFKKLKSNGTKAKRPLQHIQKPHRAKKKTFFFMVFHGVFAWIVSKIKRGRIFPEMEWGMDFNGNQMRIAIIIIEIITSLD